MEGWIKLHRKILYSDMYRSLNSKQRDVMMVCFLLANHSENEWEFEGNVYKCKPGQFITSLQKISDFCGSDVKVQSVRTALLKLEKWGFLTNKSTKQNRLITICKWDTYQDKKEWANKDTNSQPTNDQQTTNKRLTTNNNEENKKNENNNKENMEGLMFETWERLTQKKTGTSKIDQIATIYDYSIEKIKNEYVEWANDKTEEDLEDIDRVSKSLSLWLKNLKRKEDEHLHEIHNQVFRDIWDDIKWLEQLAVLHRSDIETVHNHLNGFRQMLISRNDFKNNITETKNHYVNWVGKGNAIPERKNENEYQGF